MAGREGRLDEGKRACVECQNVTRQWTDESVGTLQQQQQQAGWLAAPTALTLVLLNDARGGAVLQHPAGSTHAWWRGGITNSSSSSSMRGMWCCVQQPRSLTGAAHGLPSGMPPALPRQVNPPKQQLEEGLQRGGLVVAARRQVRSSLHAHTHEIPPHQPPSVITSTLAPNLAANTLHPNAQIQEDRQTGYRVTAAGLVGLAGARGAGRQAGLPGPP